MATQFKAFVKEKNKRMFELQMKYTQLQTHNSQVEDSFQKQKMQLKHNFDTLLQLKEVCIFIYLN